MSKTDKRFVEDLNRIVKARSQSQQSFQVVEADSVPATRGVGEAQAELNNSGIATPLKELGEQREYYEPEYLTSSDGLFVMEVKPVHKAVFEDANGELAVFEYSNL